MDVRPTRESPDDDPYVWLEDVEGVRALAWVAGQSAATLARVADASFAADRDALTALLDRPDNLPFVTRRGGLLYNFWRDAAHPRGLWRRTTLDSYRTAAPEWDTLLDLDALASAEGEDWVWSGAGTLPPSHERAIVRLSRGGGDAVVLREFDLPSREFVADGFVLAEAKSGAAWLDADTLLLSSALGAGMATNSGYARTVRRWHRGTAPEQAPVIFEAATESVRVWGEYDRADERVVLVEGIGFFDTKIWFGDRTGAKRLLETPTDAWVETHRDWLAIRPRTTWTTGGATHSADTVLGIGLRAFLDGDRAFTVLFEPGPRRAPQGFFWNDGDLVVSILDELRPRFLVASPNDGWSIREIGGLPDIGTTSVWSLDGDEDEANGELLTLTQTPTTPPELGLTRATTAAPAILKRAPVAFDPRGAVVTRHEAVSADGERIPYVQVGPETETGDAPVHLTGYGGFGIPIMPAYSTRTGKLWIERGGTSVTASIRGGGEFGTWWHDAGRRERKVRSHDDFAAVAADLVRRGVTQPGRIAAEGGSNGGLLIANMLTRYPERFGALFCTIPLIDMRRYHRLLAGASWIAEYGNPDLPEDWAFMQTLSAYHAAEPGRPYPPILIATTRRDDRVHPGHARKMAAKLQALGYDALFYEPLAGGHGYGKDNAEVASFAALGTAFLRQAVGWTPAG